MLLLSAIVKKKVRLSGPLVRPSLMKPLHEKQRFFYGPRGGCPGYPPLGGPGLVPYNCWTKKFRLINILFIYACPFIR